MHPFFQLGGHLIDHDTVFSHATEKKRFKACLVWCGVFRRERIGNGFRGGCSGEGTDGHVHADSMMSRRGDDDVGRIGPAAAASLRSSRSLDLKI